MMGEKMKKNYLGIMLLLIGLVLLGSGISRGEVNSVYTKAVNICLECIGIG